MRGRRTYAGEKGGGILRGRYAGGKLATCRSGATRGREGEYKGQSMGDAKPNFGH